MVNLPIMMGLAISTLGLGYSLVLIRSYGFQWPNRSIIAVAVTAFVAASLYAKGLWR